MVITATEAYKRTRVPYNAVIQEGFEKCVQWGAGLEQEVPDETKRRKNKENAGRKAPGQKGAKAVVLHQGQGSLLVLLTSFPPVLEFLRPVGTELFGVPEDNLNPFAKLSSPCSSGHS